MGVGRDLPSKHLGLLKSTLRFETGAILGPFTIPNLGRQPNLLSGVPMLERSGFWQQSAIVPGLDLR